MLLCDKQYRNSEKNYENLTSSIFVEMTKNAIEFGDENVTEQYLNVDQLTEQIRADDRLKNVMVELRVPCLVLVDILLGGEGTLHQFFMGFHIPLACLYL